MKKPKLNWFSPLPPAKTGIADATAALLPALADRFDVRLWTDQNEWDGAIEKHAPVLRYQPPELDWAVLQQAELTVYNMGNNPRFHHAMWVVSRRHPGLVLLHDICLQHLFAEIYWTQGQDRTSHVGVIERYYGAEGRRDAEAYWDGRLDIHYMNERYPLTELALENALGAVVHTRTAFEELRSRSRWPVAFAPLPYAVEGAAASARAKRSARRGPHRIVIFGFIGPNRRVESVLKALAGFAQKARFRFEICGELWDADRIRGQIDALELGKIFTLRGFLPEAELQRTLAASDLAINLRYPTMGEASLSQLQIWSHALPSLVTPVGWYAELPEQAVAFVDPEQEIVDIQAHLRAFLEDPARFARMGEEGRRALLERHNPRIYAAAIEDFLSHAGDFRCRAAAFALAERGGFELSPWVDTNHFGENLVRTATAIHNLCF